LTAFRLLKSRRDFSLYPPFDQSYGLALHEAPLAANKPTRVGSPLQETQTLSSVMTHEHIFITNEYMLYSSVNR
jgi:hypothetical protein